jgi:transcriptional regulator with XRE-family HTH domain
MQSHQRSDSQPAKRRRNRSSLSLHELMQMRMDKLRINAQAVSRRSGLSPGYISRLLSGERLVCEDETAQKLAKGIAVDWVDVFRASRISRAKRQEAKAPETPSIST